MLRQRVVAAELLAPAHDAFEAEDALQEVGVLGATGSRPEMCVHQRQQNLDLRRVQRADVADRVRLLGTARIAPARLRALTACSRSSPPGNLAGHGRAAELAE
ncbi:hypothetical protein [Streptomyces sp. NPDC001389]|uniref:hypothetical protein n=1 Tax=Streptomyces sp. NPDC001389 TaxID=3364569 RepID=UPI0036B4BAA0